MTLGSILGVIAGLPLEDIEAAINDPTNLGKEAKIVEDIISVAMPGLDGMVVSALVSLFVSWVYASGGGTISSDPNPIADAQTTMGRGGRRA